VSQVLLNLALFMVIALVWTIEQGSGKLSLMLKRYVTYILEFNK